MGVSNDFLRMEMGLNCCLFLGGRGVGAGGRCGGVVWCGEVRCNSSLDLDPISSCKIATVAFAWDCSLQL